MSEAEIAALENDKDTIDTIQHTRRVIQIWEAVGDLLKDPGIEVSGRLTLKQRNGQRVVAWKGVAPISKQFQVPTLLLDATLPPLPLLQVYHPQVEVVADIKAAMPAHTRIRQVLGAPTSSNKLDDEKHLDSMRRIILQRWIETGREATLVICQQKVENALRQCGLPANIAARALQQHRRARRFQDGAAGHADRAHRAGTARHGGAGGGAVGAAADRGHGAGRAASSGTSGSSAASGCATGAGSRRPGTGIPIRSSR